MIQDFRILHRRKPNVFPAPVAAPLWQTCLRSLAFGNLPAEPQDEIFQRDEAYQFLLEIICGMHSPIVGETEVFGQFKQFAQEWVAREPRRAALVQRLIGDAKAIRAEYLTGIGHQSYGGWVRRELKSETVHVIGGGHLAQEILPFVAKRAKVTHVHVRDPRKVGFHAGPTHALADRAFDGGALVIAAPMTAAEIEAWCGGLVPEQIFDLRDVATCDALALPTQIHRLQDIFTQIERTKARLVPVISQVQSAIAARAAKLAGAAVIRPLGWDDLCA